MKDFHPMNFGHGLWVCPHEQEVPEDNATVVYLDPGLAFGTGTHETTALCLEWLGDADLTGKLVMDYGCGSGILALAALKLGAGRFTAWTSIPRRWKPAWTMRAEMRSTNAWPSRSRSIAPPGV